MAPVTISAEAQAEARALEQQRNAIDRGRDDTADGEKD